MLKRLISRIAATHRCGNTRLELDIDSAPSGDWLVVRMVDKCTGATYEATYSPATARRILAELTDRVHQMHQI